MIVECINDSFNGYNLTLFKRYEVISQRVNKRYLFQENVIEIEIINDAGVAKFYTMETKSATYFVDVTDYVREEKLNELGTRYLKFLNNFNLY